MNPKKIRPRAFEGFEPEAFRFLAELEANNERAWFAENKDRFERLWKAPLEALVEDAEPALGSGKAFRIHRDVRFSPDKRPYKTHASAVFERDGIVFYAHFEKDQAFVATGMHMMAKDQVKRLHAAVDDEKSGRAIEKLVAKLEEAGLTIGGEALKTAPRGYPKDHPRVRLLRHKGLTASRTWAWKKRPPAWLTGPDALPTIAQGWAEASRLNDWLSEHVGPSTEGNRWVKR